MGDLTAGWSLFFGVVLAAMWMVIGAGVVSAWRRDLAAETWTALLNCVCWPAGLVVQLVIAPIYRRRRERARQQRITAKVESGQYAADYARDQLGWKG